MKTRIDMDNLWYEVPHQVRVFGFNKGIVFHDYFIDAVTGAAWPIKDLMRIARIIGITNDDAIIEYDDWVDFSKKI
jgi:hypothetical protein